MKAECLNTGEGNSQLQEAGVNFKYEALKNGEQKLCLAQEWNKAKRGNDFLCKFPGADFFTRIRYPLKLE